MGAGHHDFAHDFDHPSRGRWAFAHHDGEGAVRPGETARRLVDRQPLHAKRPPVHRNPPHRAYRGFEAASICWIAAASNVTSAAPISSFNWSRFVADAIGAVTDGRAISHAIATWPGFTL